MSWFKKNKRKKGIDQMINELKKILEKYNALLIEFDKNDRIFGNMIVKIKLNNKNHIFIVDKGEIYHNQELICNNSYHVAGKSDAFPKLLEVIKEEFSKIK